MEITFMLLELITVVSAATCFTTGLLLTLRYKKYGSLGSGIGFLIVAGFIILFIS